MDARGHLETLNFAFFGYAPTVDMRLQWAIMKSKE